MGRARSSTAQRLAAIRSFHRFAAREGLAPGDPWGAIATPRLPRRLPRVLEVDEVERLLDAVDDGLGGDGRGPGPGTSADARGRDRASRPGARRDRVRRRVSGSASWPRPTSASLDLRRGEIRVLGKGRKERIGLLGRPARAALEGYLEDGRARPRRAATRRRY